MAAELTWGTPKGEEPADFRPLYTYSANYRPTYPDRMDVFVPRWGNAGGCDVQIQPPAGYAFRDPQKFCQDVLDDIVAMVPLIRFCHVSTYLTDPDKSGQRAGSALTNELLETLQKVDPKQFGLSQMECLPVSRTLRQPCSRKRASSFCRLTLLRQGRARENWGERRVPFPPRISKIKIRRYYE